MAEPSRLCLVLERVSEEVHEPEFVATLPVLGFEAFVPGSRMPCNGGPLVNQFAGLTLNTTAQPTARAGPTLEASVERG